MNPRRIQLSRRKGWRKPTGAVVIARPGKWGNPYPVAEHGRQRAVDLYRRHLADHPDLVEAARRELRGRDSRAGARSGDPCHGDALLEVARGDGLIGQ
jgi:hypothetical protein